MYRNKYQFRHQKNTEYSFERKMLELELKKTSDQFAELDPEIVDNPLFCKLAVLGHPVKCVKRAVFDVLDTQAEATELAERITIHLKDILDSESSRKEDLVMEFRCLEYCYGEEWDLDSLIDRLVQEISFLLNPRLTFVFRQSMTQLKPKLSRRVSSYLYDPFNCSMCSCYTGTCLGESFLDLPHFEKSRKMKILLIFVFWTSFFKKLADYIATY